MTYYRIYFLIKLNLLQYRINCLSHESFHCLKSNVGVELNVSVTNQKAVNCSICLIYFSQIQQLKLILQLKYC